MRTPRRAAAPPAPRAAPAAPKSVVSAQQWNALVDQYKALKQANADMLTMFEDMEKKVKRLVAITLRDDFQKAFPWDPNAPKSSNPDDAVARAAQKAAAIRAQASKRESEKKKD